MIKNQCKTLQDGSHYAGEWKEDKKEGEGTMFYANGDVFAGHWKQERKEGEGEYIYSSGKVTCITCFKLKLPVPLTLR
jgi:hypothetical protein